MTNVIYLGNDSYAKHLSYVTINSRYGKLGFDLQDHSVYIVRINNRYYACIGKETYYNFLKSFN